MLTIKLKDKELEGLHSTSDYVAFVLKSEKEGTNLFIIADDACIIDIRTFDNFGPHFTVEEFIEEFFDGATLIKTFKELKEFELTFKEL